MVSQDVITEIDRIIKSVWVKEIKRDYRNGALLYEDSLKCSLYFHLRKKLDKILKENNLRIFSEFTFPGLKYRADLVIVEIDPDWWEKDQFLRSSILSYVAIIELKYTDGVDLATENWIKADFRKFKRYFQEGGLDCQFYFAIVYEAECSCLNWLDKRSTKKWANGRVTELDSGWIDGTMLFEVNSYNGLNES